MPLSDFIESSRIRFNHAAFDWEAVLIHSTILPFTMQPQTQTNWCWAATATSVSRFYSSLSSWTQCSVAGAELGLSCCVSPVPGGCNIPWFLDRALTRTNNFVSISGPLSTSKIEDELKKGRVVGARIGWAGGGGHFMVIRGYTRIGISEFFDISDPIFGDSQVTVATFTNSYQGNGSWTHTYLTKKWPTWRIDVPIFIDPDLLDLIRKIRPTMLQFNRQRGASADIGEAELAMPHEVYVVGLEDLVRRDNPLPDAPTAVRVVEVERGRFNAAYEITTTADKPDLQAVTSDAATLKHLEQSLSAVTRIAESRKEDSELRLVRIPGLYVEALLLHSPDGEDIAVVVRNGGMDLPEELPAGELFARLRRAAEERLSMSRDDTIAP